MAYTPKNWQCGDLINASDLNRIEQGISDCCGCGDLFLITFANKGDHWESDKSVAEIRQAYQEGKRILGREIVEGEGDDFFYPKLFVASQPGYSFFEFIRLRPYTSLDETTNYLGITRLTMSSSNPYEVTDDYLLFSSPRT